MRLDCAKLSQQGLSRMTPRDRQLPADVDWPEPIDQSYFKSDRAQSTALAGDDG